MFTKNLKVILHVFFIRIVPIADVNQALFFIRLIMRPSHDTRDRSLGRILTHQAK